MVFGFLVTLDLDICNSKLYKLYCNLTVLLDADVFDLGGVPFIVIILQNPLQVAVELL